MTLYEILGIEPTATLADIKRAYRKLAMKHHPDVGGNLDEFRVMMRAYEVLSDPERRARYDATGDDGEAQPDNSAAQVLSMIQGAFDRAMQHGSLDHRDLVAEARRHLETDRQQGKAANTELEKGAEKFRKVLKRLKFTGAGENIVARTLESRIAEIERHVADNTRTMDLVGRAIEALAEYAYEFESADFPVPSGRMSEWVFR